MSIVQHIGHLGFTIYRSRKFLAISQVSAYYPDQITLYQVSSSSGLWFDGNDHYLILKITLFIDLVINYDNVRKQRHLTKTNFKAPIAIKPDYLKIYS